MISGNFFSAVSIRRQLPQASVALRKCLRLFNDLRRHFRGSSWVVRDSLIGCNVISVIFHVVFIVLRLSRKLSYMFLGYFFSKT